MSDAKNYIVTVIVMFIIFIIISLLINMITGSGEQTWSIIK